MKWHKEIRKVVLRGVGDNLKYWWQNHHVSEIFGSLMMHDCEHRGCWWQKRLNLSSTYQTWNQYVFCLQHLSPTSMLSQMRIWKRAKIFCRKISLRYTVYQTVGSQPPNRKGHFYSTLLVRHWEIWKFTWF